MDDALPETVQALAATLATAVAALAMWPGAAMSRGLPELQKEGARQRDNLGGPELTR